MILANFVTIAKYGMNIFLAIMGFISFDDINEKQIYNEIGNGLNENNYVQFIIPNETANNVYYADDVYFPINEKPINYMICKQDEVPIEINKNSFQPINERDEDISSKLLVCMNESLIEFDVIVIDPNNKWSSEKYIKVFSVNENYSLETQITNSEIIISDLTN